MVAVNADEQRLYGPPDAESMDFDPDQAATDYLAIWDHEAGETFTIEEWTVHPPSYHLPDASALLDMIDEASSDELSLGFGDCYIPATTGKVKEITERFLAALAEQITWRQADRHVADLTYRCAGADCPDPVLVERREVTP